MRNIKIAFFLFGIFFVLLSVLGGVDVMAAPSDPAVFSKGAADTSKADGGLTKYVEWATYFGLLAGAATIATGITRSAGIFGQVKEGKAMLINGVYVCVGSGAVYLILYVVDQIKG